MTVTAFRICKAKHSRTAFSGEGARLYGGRWNSRGTAVVYYTAGSVSLAVLEMLVHLESHQLLQAYHLCQAAFDEKLMETIAPNDLPAGWRSSPTPVEVQQAGDDWIARGSSAVLRVPSAIVETEWNFLLNPAHPDFALIEIGTPRPYRFDSRLLEKTDRPDDG